MNTARKAALSLICALTLVGNSPGILAQSASQDKSPEPNRTMTLERQVFSQATLIGEPGQEMHMPPDVLIGSQDPTLGFSYLSTEMSFDGKVVKGAPFSADAVTESVQVLADGNRIVRSSTTGFYRDSEGRTRREQSLGAIGPMAAAGNQHQMIFINDPVAGTNYILDPGARTARKMQIMVSQMRRSSNDVKPDGESGNVVFMTRADGDSKQLRVVPNGVLQGSAIKRVQPSYPTVAKAAGVSGQVLVQVLVGPDGRVLTADAVSGHPLLRDASVEAARQWQFKPTELSGAAAPVQGVLTFNFTLRDSSDDAARATAAPAAGVPMIQQLPKPVTESLGEQMFDGIKAVGTRSVTTIPAGQMGNEKPLEIVFEKWYSPELQTVIMTRQSDPRFGENTYKLVNIVRKDPAKSLFEIPSDYTTSSGGAQERTFNWKVQQPNQQ
jgi:TonB family protein